ncbi:terpenoid synthase [Sistotremastrum suecicum HHB10207 ss-3]|uniref:Terpene synthase n=1 Tax=Sistotremastrum suecicum HHB10207 ss-3 TaxID=1314776 RepID=A0A166GYJ0_9AGAM|nr:terpenoid synthase [Sistotremastrum suecicum HHB10207 ss-3]
MSTTTTTVQLPDLLAGWPMQRTINPHYEEVATESADWVETFEPFDAKYLAIFRKCKFEILRTGCDLMNAFFVFDDISDEQCASDVQKGADIIMDAIRNPYDPRPEGDSVLGEVYQSFWSRALLSSSRSAAHRFVDHFQNYVDSVVQQAADRDSNHIRSIEDYLILRRHTIGVLPSFDILQMDKDLPDHVVYHPKVLALVELATDMIILANDIYSYNVEQSRGDDAHNLVAVAMKEQNLDVQEAMDYVGRRYYGLRDTFLAGFHDLPSWSPKIDSELKDYIWGVGNWVTANVEWSFESERYFGTRGPEIREHRSVALLPRRV